METTGTKTCPLCAEPVREEAARCPHCRGFLSVRGRADAFRNHPDRQIAGVSTALAHAFDVSVTFVRLAFIVLTFTSFVGPLVYVALWLVLPFDPEDSSALGRVTARGGAEPSVAARLIDWADERIQRLTSWLRPTTPTSETANGSTSASGGPGPAEGAP